MGVDALGVAGTVPGGAFASLIAELTIESTNSLATEAFLAPFFVDDPAILIIVAVVVQLIKFIT
jgi:hypothetical protein